RDVVDEDRDVHRVRHGTEVAVEPLLGRPVVVRVDHEGAGGPGLLGVTREVDRLRGGVGPGARDDVEAAAGRFDDDLDDAPVLIVAEGGRLPRGAARHNAVGALRHVRLDELPELGLVDLTAAERSDQRDDGTLEHGAHSEILHGSKLSAKERRVTLAPQPETLQESFTSARRALPRALACDTMAT